MENEQTAAVAENAAPLTNEQVLQQLEALRTQLAAVQASKQTAPSGKMLPNPSRRYVLLESELKGWGRVPLQQAEIAKLLGATMEVGKEYTEAEVFQIVKDNAPSFPSLARSVQTPERLFRYYRNLKNDGKHAGFSQRGFLQVAG